MNNTNDSNTPYNAQTAAFLGFLKDTHFDKRKELWDQIIQKNSDRFRMESETDDKGNPRIVLYLPSSKDRTNAIILERRDELKEQGLGYGKYARYYFDRSPSQIGNIINGVTCPRDIFINGILMMRTPLTVADANHALMELGMPGLFTDTYIQTENLRNYVLCRLLTHINALGAPQEKICWPEFAWNMMAYLGLPLLPGRRGNPDRLSASDRALIDGWYADANATLKRVNYMKRRKHYLRRYQNGGKTLLDLAKDANISVQCCRDLCSSDFPTEGKHGNRGARDYLIWLSVGLGCTLAETNAMLREANHALLYPPLESLEYGHRIPILLQNAIDRESDPD